MRFACLPAPWTITDFDFAQPGVDEKLVRDLAPLRFLDDAANVLFVGPPGVGKTMLAVALARWAAEAGARVYFTAAADLAARCPKAALEGRWNTVMRFFAGPRELVIDELGYLPLPGDGASALFQVVNQRCLKSSTILTTNVGIADWAGVFGNATVAATGSCTAPPSSASTAPPTGYAPINRSPTPCAPPPATALDRSSGTRRAWQAAVPADRDAGWRSERGCPICWTAFMPAGPKHRSCSDRCRKAGHTRRHTVGDQHDERPQSRPAPVAARACPHCGHDVSDVALLTTPEAARPAVPDPAGVIRLRRA